MEDSPRLAEMKLNGISVALASPVIRERISYTQPVAYEAFSFACLWKFKFLFSANLTMTNYMFILKKLSFHQDTYTLVKVSAKCQI